jgi:hypothetical protein
MYVYPAHTTGPPVTGPEELDASGDLDVASLSPPSLIRNLLDALGVERLADLLALDLDAVARMRGVGRGKVDALAELIARAEALAQGDWSPGPSLLEEVDAAGVDLDMPWRAILLGVDARAAGALERAGVETLRELTIRYEAGTLTDLPGLGATSRDRIGAQLDALATLGFERYLFGEVGRPERVRDALEVFLGSPGPDRDLVRRRFLDGHTLERLGDALGVSRERARQRLERALEQGTSHVGPVLVELLGPLIDLLEAQGGLTTLARAAELCACSHDELALALTLARDPARLRRFGDLTLVTPLSVGSLDALLSDLHASLEHAPAFLDDGALADRARAVGLDLPLPELRALAAACWDAELLPGAIANPWRSAEARVGEVLEDLARPSSIEEVARALGARLGLEPPPSERHVYGLLGRCEDAYYVSRGRWAHASTLPSPPEDLREAARWCVARLRDVPHAVSAAIFLDPLVSEGVISPEVSSLLLRDAIGRHPDARVFQSTDFVAHAQAFSGPRVTQRERVERILLDAGAPMRCDDVCEAMPDFVSFSRDAVYLTLLNAPFTLNLGRGRFVHCDVDYTLDPLEEG